MIRRAVTWAIFIMLRLGARAAARLTRAPVYAMSHLQLEMTIAHYVRRNCCRACAQRLTGRV